MCLAAGACMLTKLAMYKVWIKIYVYLRGPSCGVFNFILAIFFLCMTADVHFQPEAAHDTVNFPSNTQGEPFFQNIPYSFYNRRPLKIIPALKGTSYLNGQKYVMTKGRFNWKSV